MSTFLVRVSHTQLITSTTANADGFRSITLPPVSSLHGRLPPVNVLFTIPVPAETTASNLSQFRRIFSLVALKQSFQVMVDRCPQISGQLEADDRGNLCLKMDNSGAGWKEAWSEQPLSCLIPRFSHRFCSRPFFELPQKCITLCPIIDGSFQPIFAVQVTSFACGSLALGFSANHAILDAYTAGKLINLWSYLHSVLFSPQTVDSSLDDVWKHYISNSLELPLDWNPSNLSRNGCSRPIDCPYLKKSSDTTEPSTTTISLSVVKVSTQLIHFSRHDLDDLKRVASAKLPRSCPFISSQDALYALTIQLLWEIEQMALLTKGSPSQIACDDLYISMMVNGRKLSEKPHFLGSFSFGFFDRVTQSTVHDLSFLSSRINNLHARQTEESLRLYMEYVSPTNHLKETDVDPSFFKTPGFFLSSSWAKMEFMSPTFGFASNSSGKRKVIDFAGPPNVPLHRPFFLDSFDGGMDICLCLSEDIWMMLKSFPSSAHNGTLQMMLSWIETLKEMNSTASIDEEEGIQNADMLPN